MWREELVMEHRRNAQPGILFQPFLRALAKSLNSRFLRSLCLAIWLNPYFMTTPPSPYVLDRSKIGLRFRLCRSAQAQTNCHLPVQSHPA
jgi:hypothetical protein